MENTCFQGAGTKLIFSIFFLTIGLTVYILDLSSDKITFDRNLFSVDQDWLKRLHVRTVCSDCNSRCQKINLFLMGLPPLPFPRLLSFLTIIYRNSTCTWVALPFHLVSLLSLGFIVLRKAEQPARGEMRFALIPL